MEVTTNVVYLSLVRGFINLKKLVTKMREEMPYLAERSRDQEPGPNRSTGSTGKDHAAGAVDLDLDRSGAEGAEACTAHGSRACGAWLR